MGQENVFQCQSCGALHRLNIYYDIDSDLYVRMKCPRCRGETLHLWCGEDESEIYIYYNINLDLRYY